MVGTLMEMWDAFDALSGAKGAFFAVAAMILLWRWLVSRDRAAAAVVTARGDQHGVAIAEVRGDVSRLGVQVQACAMREDLRRTDGELAALKTEVKVNEARVIQRLDGLDKRLEGQGDVLGRIEGHLLRSKE